MKIYQYLGLLMKIICWRFHIKTPFTFWDMLTWNMWKVFLTNVQKHWNMLKNSLLSNKFTNSRTNDPRILRIKDAKFSVYCFYMNTNIYRYFQICISVTLKQAQKVNTEALIWSIMGNFTVLLIKSRKISAKGFNFTELYKKMTFWLHLRKKKIVLGQQRKAEVLLEALERIREYPCASVNDLWLITVRDEPQVLLV